MEDNRHLSISYEEVLNDMSVPKSEKARFYWQIIKQNGYSKEDGEIIWDGDKIKGFKLYQPIESIDITVTL